MRDQREYWMMSPDLKSYCMTWEGWHPLAEVREEYRKMSKPSYWNSDYVLVLAEWESEAEANRARLEWFTPRFLLRDIPPAANEELMSRLAAGEPLMKAAIGVIDDARKAPHRNLTVVARPDDVKGGM